jgi:hypothetical protein
LCLRIRSPPTHDSGVFLSAILCRCECVIGVTGTLPWGDNSVRCVTAFHSHKAVKYVPTVKRETLYIGHVIAYIDEVQAAMKTHFYDHRAHAIDLNDFAIELDSAMTLPGRSDIYDHIQAREEVRAEREHQVRRVNRSAHVAYWI